LSKQETATRRSDGQQAAISALYQEAPDVAAAYICQRIEGQIAYYEAKSSRNKRIYYGFSAVAIVANAMVPVVSVFIKTADGNDGLKFIIAALSSLALIASSLMALYNARELWAKYRRSAGDLTSLLHQYYTRTGVFDGLGEQEAFRTLATVAEARLDEENKDWSALLQQSAKTPGGAAR